MLSMPKAKMAKLSKLKAELTCVDVVNLMTAAMPRVKAVMLQRSRDLIINNMIFELHQLNYVGNSTVCLIE